MRGASNRCVPEVAGTSHDPIESDEKDELRACRRGARLPQTPGGADVLRVCAEMSVAGRKRGGADPASLVSQSAKPGALARASSELRTSHGRPAGRSSGKRRAAQRSGTKYGAKSTGIDLSSCLTMIPHPPRQF